MSDEQVAAPSPAAVEVAEPIEVENLNDEQYSSWRKTGDLPVQAKQEAPPASEPGDAKPASAKKAESGTAKKKPDQEKNWRALETERDTLKGRAEALESELAEFRKGKTAGKTEETPKAPEAPTRPSPFDWTGTKEEFAAAQEKWEAHQRSETIRQFQMDAQAEATRQTVLKQFEEAKAKYPDAQPKIAEATNVFAKAEIPGVIRAMLNDSEVLADLMYVMSDKETRDNFIEASNKNPGKAIRALAQMERDIVSKRTAPPDNKSDSDATAPKLTVTSAKKPPAIVGGHASAAPDEEKEVLKKAAAGDDDATSRYIALANAREVAKRKGR